MDVDIHRSLLLGIHRPGYSVTPDLHFWDELSWQHRRLLTRRPSVHGLQITAISGKTAEINEFLGQWLDGLIP